MKATRIKIVALFALLTASMLLAACNTTRGVGKDLEEAGEGIQDAASN